MIADAVRVAAPHPLQHQVDVVAQAMPWLGLRLHPGGDLGPDWVRCADVRDDAQFFAAWRDDVRELLRAQHGTVPPGVVPFMWTEEWYVGLPGQVAGLFLALARRLPDVSATGLAFHRETTERYPDGVALLSGAFSCLPDDPAADHPDATVVPDEHALAALARDRVVDHVGPALEHTTPGVRIGPRQLWGLVTDALDESMWSAGVACDDVALAADRARVLLGEEHPPLVGTTTITTLVDARGRTQWYRERQTCCFHYRLPGQRDHPCFGCPRTAHEDRVQRAAEWPDRGPF